MAWWVLSGTESATATDIICFVTLLDELISSGALLGTMWSWVMLFIPFVLGQVSHIWSHQKLTWCQGAQWCYGIILNTQSAQWGTDCQSASEPCWNISANNICQLTVLYWVHSDLTELVTIALQISGYQENYHAYEGLRTFPSLHVGLTSFL